MIAAVGLAPPPREAYVIVMRGAKTKILTVALAALMALGTLDAASARQRRSIATKTAAHGQRTVAPPGQPLVPVDRDGTPIIMQGYRSPAMMRDDAPTKPEQAGAPTAR